MKITRHFSWAILFCLLSPILSPASARTVQDFDADWLFSKGNFAAAMMPAFDDSRWRTVTLPHDWSSDGPFTDDWGSGNGYAPGGIGWYRKHFQLDTNQANASVTLEFDGVYDYSEVWINGKYAGGRPYGFSSFQCDLAPFVKHDGGENTVAVRVDHSRFADSRYYTGSGIYRNVRLVIADKLHIGHWGVSITAPKVSSDSATVHVETTIENTSTSTQSFTLETDILAPDGQTAGTSQTTANIYGIGTLVSDPARPISLPQELAIPTPQLWNSDNPKLYRAITKIISNGTILDQVTNTFGIREFHFDADKGFFLNGKSMKIKGVCLHHDAGSLGA
ncbi:MAG TPA: beta galactosidase jelly roll domain-containing protein, partial [Candidatus Acidoferrum sp.]|nr:beta galactosidase jelly roll domain-containing protein [Candidatus Acidoferrum sp.]